MTDLFAIIAEVLRRIREASAEKARQLLYRVRRAREKAEATGDTSDLESLRDDARYLGLGLRA